MTAAKQADTAGLAICVDSLQHTFPNGVEAIRRVDLEIAAGEFVAILGPSGCGKSTLLRVIAGLERQSGGAVSVGAAPVGGRADGRADVAFVFQDAHLLPWRTVLANAALPLELRGIAKEQRTSAAVAALVSVGLAGFEERYPAQLSGGMKMRVSIARALVTRPRLLLMDEPFAALDEITRQKLDDLLRKLWADTGMTVLFVTHSTEEATFLANRAVVMSRRPGRIMLDHAIDLPAERSADLRGDVAFARNARAIYSALERGQTMEVA